MKIKNRIFSILVVLCMLVGTLGVLPMTAFAASEAKITPSATGGTYDEGTNTLTVVGGGEVSFTASGGIEFESVDGTKQPKDGEDTTVDDNVSATLDGTKWVVALPNEDAEYIFFGYYQVEVSGGVSTEAVTFTVIVIENTPLVYTNAEEAVSVEFTVAEGVTVPVGTSMKVEDYAVKKADVVNAYKSVYANETILDNAEKTIKNDVGIQYFDARTIKTNNGDVEVRLAEVIEIDGDYFVVVLFDVDGPGYRLISLSEEYEYLGFANSTQLDRKQEQNVEKIEEVYQVNGSVYIAKYKFTTLGGDSCVALYEADGSPVGIIYNSEASFNSEYKNKTETVAYENGVINLGNGNYILKTDAGFKNVSTVWSKDVYFADTANNRLVLAGDLHFSGDSNMAIGAIVHIGATGVDVGTKTDDGWNIAMSDQSPVIAFNVSDFAIPTKTVSLTVGLVDEPQAPDGLSTDAIVAIVIACVVVLAGGGFALYLFVFKKKKEDV